MLAFTQELTVIELLKVDIYHLYIRRIWIYTAILDNTIYMYNFELFEIYINLTIMGNFYMEEYP